MQRLLLVTMICGAWLAGCGEATTADESKAKGAEEVVLGADGKADSFYRPTEHGALSFSAANPARFEEDALFHAWDFSLDGDAWIELRTETTGNLDTVAYLYHRQPGATSWGRYIAKNDDHEDNLWSLISADVSAGEFRLLVKPFKTQMRGEFTVWAQCEGAGCPGTGEAGALLNEAERDAVLLSLDNICPDTFCGGDFDYYMVDLECDGGGTCRLEVRAQFYGEATGIDEDRLNDFTTEQLTVESEGEYGPFIGRIQEIRSIDDGMWAFLSCTLDGGFTTRESVMTDSSSPQYSWELYSHFMDCIAELTPLLYEVWGFND